MLSRDEIEGELRDVFAKMSDAELARQLDGEWRELVEAELGRRREKSLTPANGAEMSAAAIHPAQSPTLPSVAADMGVAAVQPAQSPTPPSEGTDMGVAAAHPAQSPTPPSEGADIGAAAARPACA